MLTHFYGRSNLSAFSAFSILFLWIACVFDPVGMIFGLKFLAIFLVYLVLFFRFLLDYSAIRASRNYFLLFLLFVFLLPTYGLLVAFFRGGLTDAFIDTSYISSAVYFVCSLVYLQSRSLVVGFSALIYCLRLLSIVVLITFMIVSAGLPSDLINYFLSHGVALIGSREYSGFNFYYIYFVASPMIIFLLSYEAWMLIDKPSVKRFLFMLLPVISLFLSGTRASILISLLGVVFVWLWHWLGRGSLFFVLFSIIIFGIILAFVDIPVISAMFSAHEQSNSIKIGYLDFYARIFHDPATIIFGQGYNAHVWSKDFANIIFEGASKSELTYLEALRVFGLFVWLLLISGLLFLSLSKKVRQCDYPWLAPAMFIYMCVSALNPYIFSSNGMLLIGFVAAAISMQSSNARDQHFKGNANATCLN